MKQRFIFQISIVWLLVSDFVQAGQAAQARKLANIVDVVKVFPQVGAAPRPKHPMPKEATPKIPKAMPKETDADRRAREQAERINVLYARILDMQDQASRIRHKREKFIRVNPLHEVRRQFAEELKALEAERVLLEEIVALPLEQVERDLFNRNHRYYTNRHQAFVELWRLFEEEERARARRAEEVEEARRRFEEEERIRMAKAEDAERNRPENPDAGMSLSQAFKDLGLGVTATWEEVSRKFKELAVKYHPDKCPADRQTFCLEQIKKITRARNFIKKYREDSLAT